MKIKTFILIVLPFLLILAPLFASAIPLAKYDISYANKELNIVWVDELVRNNQMFFSKSTDNGKTWTNRFPLNDSRHHYCYPPKISINKGTIHVAWVDYGQNKNGEIRYLRSQNSGKSWDKELILVSEANETTTLNIETHLNYVFLSWRDVYGKMFFLRSKDKGETWEEPYFVDSANRYGDYNFAPIIISDNDNLYYIWDDFRKDKKSFRAYIDIIPLLDGTKNNIAAINYYLSKDNGKTWPQKFNTFLAIVQPKGEKTDIFYPDVIIEKNTYHSICVGKFNIRNYEILYKKSLKNIQYENKNQYLDKNLANITMPSFAIDINDVHVVWTDKTDDITAIKYKNISKIDDTQSKIFSLTRNKNLYNLKILKLERKNIIVFYEKHSKGHSMLMYFSSNNNGSSWEKNSFPFSEKTNSLFPISKNGRIGFINSTGNIVIKPQYPHVLKFREGLAGVKVKNKYGFINTNGKMIIKPKFDEIDSFHEGLARVRVNNLWGFINKRGKFAIKPAFKYAYNFSEGLARIEALREHREKYRYVCDDGFGFIDKSGEIVIPPKFSTALDFHEGLAVVSIKSLFGYIDYNGNVVIPAKYSSARDFSEGLAAVKFGNKFGYINKKGNTVVNFSFESAFKFSNGLACISKGNKYGFIDKKGRSIIPLKYREPSSFSENLAKVMINKKYGYIDKSDSIVIEPQFDSADNFKNYLAKVELKNTKGYINKKGIFIWQQNKISNIKD